MPGNPCAAKCDIPFQRVLVYPRIAVGGARIEWELSPGFPAPGPYTFQLQASTAGTPTAEDWEDIGPPAQEALFLLDSQQRDFGVIRALHYRVVLTSADGAQFTSDPVPCYGALDFRRWRLLKEVLRREALYYRQSDAGRPGFLLKRKISGKRCSCRDAVTEEVINPQCSECYGTGWVGGYHPAIACFLAAAQPFGIKEELDQQLNLGTLANVGTTARMLAIPQIRSGDVWVEAANDFRWMIRSVQNIVEIGGVPAVCQVELRLAAWSDPIYLVPRTDALEDTDAWW